MSLKEGACQIRLRETGNPREQVHQAFSCPWPPGRASHVVPPVTGTQVSLGCGSGTWPRMEAPAPARQGKEGPQTRFPTLLLTPRRGMWTCSCKGGREKTSVWVGCVQLGQETGIWGMSSVCGEGGYAVLLILRPQALFSQNTL